MTTKKSSPTGKHSLSVISLQDEDFLFADLFI